MGNSMRREQNEGALDSQTGLPYCEYIVSTMTKQPIEAEVASERLNLRITPAVKVMIRRAAKLRQYSLTDFVVRSSQDAAEAVLAEQTRFVLPKAQWLAFNEALDAPARKIPELKRLLTEPSIFEAR